jgi:hypothetical protein
MRKRALLEAAAAIIIWWFMCVPPSVTGGYDPDVNAPMSKWKLSGDYASTSECTARLIAQPIGVGPGSVDQERARALAAKCVPAPKDKPPCAP